MSYVSTFKMLPDEWIKVGDPADPGRAEPTAPVEHSASPPDSTPEQTRDTRGRSLRHDGWTADRQRRFLALIAGGETITRACATVGMSVASAYALRDRAAGAAFALGWGAANLLAREPLADRLLARAIDGQVERITRPNGDVVERHRYDNGLASRMLARLDAQAQDDGPAGQAAARLVAAEWEAYLDLLGRDEGPARAGLFLAARAPGVDPAGDLDPVRTLARADRFVRTGAALLGEVDLGDLDLAARSGWNAEQWQRAEAAGLLVLAPEPVAAHADQASGPQHVPLVDAVDFATLDLTGELDGDDRLVWWDEALEGWRTSFAPPEPFAGDESGPYGEDGYERDLTLDEERIVAADHALAAAADRAAADARRDHWFAAMAAGLDGSDVVEEGAPVPPPHEKGRWAGLEGEDRLDRQHDGRDRQHTAGQRFQNAHVGSPAGDAPDHPHVE